MKMVKRKKMSEEESEKKGNFKRKR